MKKFIRLHEDTMPLVEMANLSVEDTGIDHGIIFISTEMTSYAPRVKYYKNRAGKDKPSASISISANPEIYEDSIKMTAQEKKEVLQFVKLNYKKLLNFWYKGNVLTHDEVTDFIHSLTKVKEA